MNRKNKNLNELKCLNCERYFALYTKLKEGFWCRMCGEKWKMIRSWRKTKKEEIKNER